MRTLPSLPRFAALGVGLFFLSTCGGGEPTGPDTPPAPVAGSLTLVSGDAQEGTVGAALTAPLVVNVKSTAGAALSGQAVTWSVASGGGSVSQSATTSGADGNAAVTWTLGGTVGAQSVTATAASFSVTFTATAAPGPVSQVVVTPSASTLEALEATLTLKAEGKDAFGNATEGTVTWSSSDAAVLTVDAQGVAKAVANGTADVVATSGQLTGKATLTVAQKVTQVTVTPQNPTVAKENTTQLTASASDANGFAVEGAVFTWTSSDVAVATVDSAGTITGVAEGTASVVATSGAGADTVTVTVTAAAFKPTQDTEVGGTVNVAEVEIPAGVTVTLKDDAVIHATGDVAIAGTLAGDCRATSIAADGDITITGTVSNECLSSAAPPADLVIVAGASLNVTGAELTSSGSLIVGDGTDAQGVGAWPAAAPRRAEGGAACTFTGGTMRSGKGAATRAPGQKIPELRLGCAAGLTLAGVTLVGAAGADGADALGSAEVKAGDGGDAGDVFLRTQGTLSFTSEGGPTRIHLGSGGRGGHATSEGPSPVAIGGWGGGAGGFQASYDAKSIPPGSLELHLGSGGDGGDAWAVANDGVNASSLTPAGKGGDADARAGSGGSHSEIDEDDGWDVNIVVVGRPGHGGKATARAGNGGMGSEQFPNGGQGGVGTAVGGDSGSTEDGTEQVVFSEFAHGGDAVFLGGNGGTGFGRCSPPAARGGHGGEGGDVKGGPGDGRHGDDGWAVFDDVANGGFGGDGNYPGGGSAEGRESLTNVTKANTRYQGDPSFQFGGSGDACPQDEEIGVQLGVLSDEGGHEPFTRIAATVNRIRLVFSSLFGVEGPEAVSSLGNLTVSGNGNWIQVSGTLNDDGTFTLTGSGTAAGFSNVSTSFTGTVSRDENGVFNGVSGTLTVGTNGELFGVPVSYTVNTAGG